MKGKVRKKTRIVKKRHQRYVRLANILLGRMIRRAYGVKQKNIDIRKHEPCLIVSNHILTFDPILMTSIFDRQIYYVASELIFSLGWKSRLLTHCFAPIPKTKSMADVTTVKNIMQIINEGGSVGVYVEGNATMTGGLSSMPAAIGKLVLRLKVPLVIYNFEGGYLSLPRWATYTKREKHVRGKIRKVLYYEDYKDMTADEINDIIIENININAYEEIPQYTYRGKRNAEGLHRLLFTCPICHGVNTAKTAYNNYLCAKYGEKLTYDEHGYLHSDKWEKPQNLIELDKANKLAYQEHIINNPHFSVSVPGNFTEVFRKRRKHFGPATLTLSREGLTIKFKRKMKRHVTQHFTLDQLDTMAMQQKEVLVIYPRYEQTKMLKIPKTEIVSSYQLVVTLQILKNIMQYAETKPADIPRLDAQELGL
ncbi:MAG: 2-acyl-glycerophospho-ethanolamine acyltransferase [Tenericutes bacterium ADurb.Bin087]|nr:MAG: 2-acyl-glycerophospho-ethanolamine acyltransferase [Tenericutes bacterium ADurb.Bin087]